MEDYIMHDMVVNRFIENKEDKDKMVSMMQEITGRINRSEQ